MRPGHLRLTSPPLLRALMDRWDYSIADVAVVAGTHRATVSHLLSGRELGLRADRARQVAGALRVDLETLFVEPDVPVPLGVTALWVRRRPPQVLRLLAERAEHPTP